MARKPTTRNDVLRESAALELLLPAGSELVLLAKLKAGYAEAKLSSPLLDRNLHRDGSAKMLIETEPVARTGTAEFRLDTFAVNSLREYLHTQARVRRLLQEALTRDRERWNKHNAFRQGDIWQQAEVRTVAFDKKNVPTPNSLAKIKAIMPKLDLKRVVAKADKQNTRSSFTIQLDVAWDLEHWRLALFRDGALVELTL
jgi:hypothetical protein